VCEAAVVVHPLEVCYPGSHAGWELFQGMRLDASDISCAELGRVLCTDFNRVGLISWNGRELNWDKAVRM
jgi:hypothetical protein